MLAVGVEWAARITTVGLEFALPPLLGALVDRWMESGPWGALVGAVLGFSIGMGHLLQIAREGTGPQAPGPRRPSGGRPPRGTE
jgi:ATP synthase protein I